ncbi:hypothetical protein AYI69_g4761 [Smittium culicis]|uniref:Uncharacterized protein n=1 Tax=Smittium culicis TaxID=133412 RepID=A0A1R1YBM7_9FUNG|nr:hypothetical protein AYI69_g4761 [Smittium culicis]
MAFLHDVPLPQFQSNSSLLCANAVLSQCSPESDFLSTETQYSQHKKQKFDESIPSANIDLFNFDISVDNNDKIVLSSFQKRSLKSYFTNEGEASVNYGSGTDDASEKSTEGLSNSHRNNLSFIVNEETPSDSVHLEISPMFNENELTFDSLKLSYHLNNCEINLASKSTNDLEIITDTLNDNEIPDVLSNDRNYRLAPLNNEISSDITSRVPNISSPKLPKSHKSMQGACSVNSLEGISNYYTQIAAILFCELGWNLSISGQNLFATCHLCYRELSLRLFTPFALKLSIPETPQTNHDYINNEVSHSSDILNLDVKLLNVNNEHYQFCYYHKN